MDRLTSIILFISGAAIITVIVMNPDGLVRTINGITSLIADLMNIGKPR